MRLFVVLSLVASISTTLWAQPDRATRPELERLLDSSVEAWRFKLGETPGAEAADCDDAAWEVVDVGHKWWPHNSTCWYRKRLTIPERVNGIPAAGATLRLKVAMDNEAKAYVNGKFKQQFTWDDGDFVVVENARPGDTVSVALYGINRPGYGSLYQAYLVSSASGPMVEAIRGFLEQVDTALSDAAFAPPENVAHWERRVAEAMARIDMNAYYRADHGAFVASVELAHAALMGDLKGLDRQLARTGRKLMRLKQEIAEGRAEGLQLAYQEAAARVVESFQDYVREDVADPNPLHRIRGLKNAQYIERLCGTTRDEVAAIRANPALERRVPLYKTGAYTIEDGAFWQNNHPVFFTGVGHFGQVHKDTPILTQYGLNIIQIEMGPNSVLTAPDTVDVEPIEQRIVATLDAAAAHNVAVNLLISPHYFPEWAVEADPEHAECGHGFIKYCIEAPNARQVHETYLRTLMPRIAHHPALHSICLSNEPLYKGQSVYARPKWRQWLVERHGTVRAMNAVYDTDFRSFAEVPMPEDDANYALFFDWCRFNQDRFLAFHAFLRDIIHEYDPDLPVHAKVMSLAFGDPSRFETGINHEDFNHLGRITGNDCWVAYKQDKESEYIASWIVAATNYRLQRSTRPAFPIFNSEAHVIPDGETIYVSDSYIRNAYWMQALHGQGAATTWVWERGQEGDLAGNILTRPNCVRALGTIALDLNRLGREVLTLQQQRSDLAIFYAYSSLLPSSDFADEAEKAFEGAYFTDTLCDFITERQAAGGGLAAYKVVVVPRAANVPEPVFRTFQEYLAQGGTVMTVGNCFARDEYGRPRAERLVARDNGRLAAYPDSLTPRAYREILNGLLDDAGAERRVRVAGEHGEPLWGINLRTVEWNGKQLVALANFTRDTQTVTLKPPRPFTRAMDLFNNTEASFPLAVPPLEPVLLALE